MSAFSVIKFVILNQQFDKKPRKTASFYERHPTRSAANLAFICTSTARGTSVDTIETRISRKTRYVLWALMYVLISRETFYVWITRLYSLSGALKELPRALWSCLEHSEVESRLVSSEKFIFSQFSISTMWHTQWLFRGTILATFAFHLRESSSSMDWFNDFVVVTDESWCFCGCVPKRMVTKYIVVSKRAGRISCAESQTVPRSSSGWQGRKTF